MQSLFFWVERGCCASCLYYTTSLVLASDILCEELSMFQRSYPALLIKALNQNFILPVLCGQSVSQ